MGASVTHLALRASYDTLAPIFIYYLLPHPTACEILVPRPGIEPAPPVLAVQNLHHWITMEMPVLLVKSNNKM